MNPHNPSENISLECQGEHEDGRQTEHEAIASDPTLPASSARAAEELTQNTKRTVATTTICSACWEGPFSAHLGLFGERIQHAGRGRKGGYAYSVTQEELKSRAEEGCKWCRLLKDIIPRSGHLDSRLNRPLGVRVGVEHPPGEWDSTPEGAQHLSIYVNDEQCFRGYVCAAADDPAAACIVARDRILDVGSPSTLALAKAAIDGCLAGHLRCIKPLYHTARLPTRLVDCSDPDHPRLVSTDGAHGTYVALSYVWGEAQPHKLTTLNLATYLNGIDNSSLPQTIRDAIVVTHALDVQYLWVDSLCIIQDSVEDNHREMVRMRLIYREAYVTIIASSAQRVSDGFLHDRPPLLPGTENEPYSRGVTLPLLYSRNIASDTPEQLGNISIFPIFMHNSPLASTQYTPAIEPIASRAWCLQEYLMSPRALLFASHTLQFRCQTETANIGGAYHSMINETRLPSTFFPQHTSLVQNSFDQGKNVRGAWLKILEDYTRRSVTLPSDKLVACGGLAAEFHYVLRSDYLAGLWRNTLLADLLWYKREGAHIPRPEEYRAPSWSWAAVDGCITAGPEDVRPSAWANSALRTAAEVVRCNVTLENVALPFGRVSGASLVLRTPLIASLWNIETPNYLRRLPSPRALKNLLASHVGEDVPDLEKAMEPIGVGYIDSEDDAGIEQVWAAPIHWRTKYMAGIVVCPVNGSEKRRKKRYRRIGYFDTVNAPVGPVDWVGELPRVEIELI